MTEQISLFDDMPHVKAHLDQWFCVESDPDRLEPDWLVPVYDKGDPIAAKRGDLFPGGAHIQFQWGEAALRVMAVLKAHESPNDEGVCDILSVFPFVHNGARNSLKVIEIWPWENGAEAWILAVDSSGDGPEIVFYDTHYSLNRDRYVIGVEADFILGAFAYKVLVTHPAPITIDDPEAIAKLSADFFDNPTGEPIVVYTNGGSSLFPCTDTAPDEYQFQAPVRKAEAIDWNERKFLRLRVPLCQDYPDIEVDLYVFEDRWHTNERPMPGADIEGFLWLHGHLA